MRWLEALNSAHIVVVGDVMLDRYWSGPARRISPEAPVPVVRITSCDERLGGAGNVAANIAALGVKASLIGVTGSDAAAESLRAVCAAHGIAVQFCELPAIPTTVKLRVLAQHQQLLRLDFEQDPKAFLGADLSDLLSSVLPSVDVVVFSDYAKGALNGIEALIQSAKHCGKTVIVDPKGNDFSRYRGADVITPNLSEFEAVVGSSRDESELIARAQAMCERHDFGAVVITRGERGLLLVQSGGRSHALPTCARDVYDVTGAGDTVCATLACALAVGVPLDHAVEISNTAAGIVVGKLGTAVVTSAELAKALGQSTQLMRSILSIDEATVEVTAARLRGERIVMTNGCFDLLHTGHVRYLEAAAALGDRLVVAVNSDASVARLKGAERPINSLADRLEVLSRLRAVDWVTSFDADTPHELIATLRPDVLVKGGDYQLEDIVGGSEVIAAGGRVLSLPFHPGYSSSRIIAAAREVRAKSE
ncbi:MAG: bifunctional D-glycero-beta-D-manno-heptose-7-phosphate kinase/D-glycero-beta-D-manno-heptose 1-phosphate adenylyltransferase HldE [Gammaproteobacteria bacterium]|nr:bifunctional D-glycero-beta-D-manno-heptose-7-phosphate kinase/D-glycero-beta-D-manno-heptose 1-phosphate adenylyltransferase HldE [Gammaproteobacteria bacterium]